MQELKLNSNDKDGKKLVCKKSLGSDFVMGEDRGSTQKGEGLLKSAYDFILPINRIADVDEKGWQSYRPNEKKILKGIKVAIVGYFNKGKTFICNRLSNSLNLDCGVLATTPFLALKEVDIDGVNYILIDSAGKGQPVDIRNRGEHANRAALEDMLDLIMPELADYYIVVVNDLVWADQLFISSIAEAYSTIKKANKPKLIVIHNWHHIGVEDINAHFEKYVEGNYNGKRKYSNDKTFFSFNVVECFNDSEINIDHFFICGEGSQSANGEMKRQDNPHFLNAKMYNDNVFTYIRNCFNIWFPASKFDTVLDPVSELLSKFNKIGHKYFTAIEDHPSLSHSLQHSKNGKNDNKNINEINQRDKDDDDDGRKEFEAVNCNHNAEDVSMNDNNKKKKMIVIDSKPKFICENGRFRLEDHPGVKFIPKTFPIKMMLSQFPSSINVPMITYRISNGKEMLCQLEIPGLNIEKFQVITGVDYWTLRLYKGELEHQIDLAAYAQPESGKAPHYGSIEMFVQIPEGFNAYAREFFVYYGNGVLLLQIFDQSFDLNLKYKIPLPQVHRVDNTTFSIRDKKKDEGEKNMQLELQKKLEELQSQNKKLSSSNTNRCIFIFALIVLLICILIPLFLHPTNQTAFRNLNKK